MTPEREAEVRAYWREINPDVDPDDLDDLDLSIFDCGGCS